AGILLHRFGTVDELELHGRGKNLRTTCAVWVVAGFALAALPPFAAFYGEHSIEGAAQELNQGWVAWLFLFCSALTSGAVFRVAGRVFRGMGRGEGAETAGARKIPEERETSGEGGGVPGVMLGPAIALLCIALAVGLIPGLHRTALNAAAELMDNAGFAARTLDSARLPGVNVQLPGRSELPPMLRAVAANIAALALAWFALSGYWPRKELYGRPLFRAVYVVRRLHSGHVGDYVAFMVAGVAVFGGMLALLVFR
ncbi:MAG: NADH-quinone oxidoreductase subunit D, partial [Acidobacteria bacterium]|nr:NADH-quinone oxidoreductase subunit D [Acidobacteriota bacterium]